jgi:hypothetical protein
VAVYLDVAEEKMAKRAITDASCASSTDHEGVLLGKVLEGKVIASVVERERCERTAYEVHWDVACPCGLKDLSDAWVGLQVLRGIRMSRRSKRQERIHVCELERVVKQKR